MYQWPSFEIALKTVTPMFMAGVYPKKDLELRPPSFRGALRYWLRAALGGVLGDRICDVRQNEQEVFGSTERGSPVILRVRCVESKESTYKRDNRKKQSNGRDYLYWSMDGRKYYAEDTIFELTLSARPGVEDGEGVLQQAVAALWLLVQLGGVGARSRRTAGSLTVAHGIEISGLKFKLEACDVSDIADELGRGLSIARKTISRRFPCDSIRVQSLPEFDILHPSVCNIWVMAYWDKVDSALCEIAEKLQKFRRNLKKIEDRAVFGLPIDSKQTTGSLEGRRASPLWIKISEVQNGEAKKGYVGIATLFKSKFLPGDPRESRADKCYEPPADYHLIEEFVKQFPGCKEVHYE